MTASVSNIEETVNPLPQKHRREMRTSLNPLVHGTDTERFDRVDAKFVQVRAFVVHHTI